MDLNILEEMDSQLLLYPVVLGAYLFLVVLVAVIMISKGKSIKRFLLSSVTILAILTILFLSLLRNNEYKKAVYLYENIEMRYNVLITLDEAYSILEVYDSSQKNVMIELNASARENEVFMYMFKNDQFLLFKKYDEEFIKL